MTDPSTTARPATAQPAYPAYADTSTRGAPTMSGLSEDEARGFNRAFAMGFVFFTLIAAVAHYAVWQWRPWIPGSAGYPVQTTQGAPAPEAPATVAYHVQR